MAIFKVPRITTAQRSAIILQKSEVVFDTNLDMLFGGDDLTVGGFPIGRGSEPTTKSIQLTSLHISEKKIVLDSSPFNSMSVSFVPEGGIPQRNGIDFEVVGNELRWNGKGLDGFMEVGEIVFLTY